MVTCTNEIKGTGKMKLIMMAVIAALAAMAWSATPQTRAEKVNERIRKNLDGVPRFSRMWNPGYTKVWTLEYLFGKDSELVDYTNRCNCLKAAFAAAVHDNDAPFAACVLMRIRREVKGFSRNTEERFVERAISTAGFVDYGESLFRERFRDDLEKCSSAGGYASVRMQAIRLKPFIIRPPTTLAEAVQLLNKKSVAADYVNGGMGARFELELSDADKEPPMLPRVEVGCHIANGEVESYDVTLEEAVRTVAESVGYTFNVGANGVVTVARARGPNARRDRN